MRKRAIVLNTAIGFGFFIIFFRLADIMLINHGKYLERARIQQTKREDVQVRRGGIFDRHGREMAVNLDLESLYCDPFDVSSPERSAEALADVTGRPSKAIYKRLTSEGRYVLLDRKLSPETAGKIRDMNIRGLSFTPDAKRFYPKGHLAAHVIGFVDIDNKGIEGAEVRYDKYLSSRGGKIFYTRDAGGRKLSTGMDAESRGSSLVLTIDEGLQYVVETELNGAMEKWRARAATAIMMDPFTGEILALANRPAYDPNSPGNVKEFERRNRAITDSYEPGSTFKIIIGTAALEEGIVKLDSRFDCSRGAVEIGGRLIHDAHRHGVLTFKEVIQKSSNVGSAMIGVKLGKERVYKYAKAFGFGEKTGIDLPGEASGRIRPPDKWSGVSIGSVSIGQEIAVTPLQILRAYSAIANGGFLVQPHVISRILTPEGKVQWAFKPEFKTAISKSTSETFRDILKTVTEEGGTATLASVNGNNVAGKTGTAQMIDPATKRYSKVKYISSFVGFVPAEDPRIAVIVVVYEPKGQNYGGVVAAPVFRKIADSALSYMEVPREDAYKNILVVAK